VIAVQLSTRIEEFFSTSSLMNKILVSAEWPFFTTSHGKGPADGIGGTMIRLAANASLQRVYNNQIQTPHELLNYCSSNINKKNKFSAMRRNLQVDLI
jgi:hypothetical protein